MKLKIVVLVGMACAGLGTSYALAKGGGPRHDARHDDPTCRHTHVHGTAAAPQSLTVTVTKAGKDSPFAPNQVVTIALGSTGQTVGVNAEGCATDASTLTADEAELHVRPTRPDPPAGDEGKQGPGDHHPPTTTGTTTTTDSSTSTTTNP